MNLTLVRHAQVDEKYQGCYNGHNEIGLSNEGVSQAKKLCKKLDLLKFDAIFCSDTFRAKETIKHYKYKENIEYTKVLREKSWGRHEGMSFDEITSSEDIKYENFLQWINALDGEDYQLYIQRVEKFFFEFLPSLEKENILILTHAGVIRVLLSIIHKIPLQDVFSVKISHGELISENI